MIFQSCSVVSSIASLHIMWFFYPLPKACKPQVWTNTGSQSWPESNYQSTVGKAHTVTHVCMCLCIGCRVAFFLNNITFKMRAVHARAHTFCKFPSQDNKPNLSHVSVYIPASPKLLHTRNTHLLEDVWTWVTWHGLESHRVMSESSHSFDY